MFQNQNPFQFQNNQSSNSNNSSNFNNSPHKLNHNQEAETCINCLKCLECCPHNLFPNYLYHASINKSYQIADELNIHLCTNCNKCSQNCSAKLQIGTTIFNFKNEIQQKLTNNQFIAQVKDIPNYPNLIPYLYQNQNLSQNSYQNPTEINDQNAINAYNYTSSNFESYSNYFSNNSYIQNLDKFNNILNSTPTTPINNTRIINNNTESKYLVLLIINLIIFILSIAKYGYKVAGIFLAILLSLVACSLVFENKSLQKIKLLFILNWSFIFLQINTVNLSYWQAAVATCFGYFFGFYFFGGLQKSFISTIALSKVFIIISYTQSSLYLSKPFFEFSLGFENINSNIPISSEFFFQNEIIQKLNLSDVLVGNLPTILGESLPIMLIVIFLVYNIFGLIDYRFSCSSIISIVVVSQILFRLYPQIFFYKPFIHLMLGGNLLFLTNIIALEPYILSRTIQGRYICAVTFSIILIYLRSFYNYSNSLYFAILINSLITPLIDLMIIKITNYRKFNLNIKKQLIQNNYDK